MSEMWRIKYDIEDAKTCLEHASHLIDVIWADFPEDEPDWPAMNEIHQKVMDAIKAVEAITTPEFKEILAGEQEDMDHLSDLADGASY